MVHLHFKTVTSTNDFARELIREHDHVMISADFQMLGRGRNNKNWEGNPSENIYCSLGIRHKIPQKVRNVSVYQGLGCLAVKEALSEITKGMRFVIKYPNDVYARYGDQFKKVCGVLVENGFLGELAIYSIIGIGINVLQEEYRSELKNKAVSLKMLGIDIMPHDLLAALKKKLQKYIEYSTDLLFELWKNELDIIGKEVLIKGECSKWTIKEIDDNACLIAVDNKEGLSKLIDNGDSIEYQLS